MPRLCLARRPAICCACLCPLVARHCDCNAAPAKQVERLENSRATILNFLIEEREWRELKQAIASIRIDDS